MILLDDLDRKIVKEMTSPASLQWDIRQSYVAIAKRLQVDEETIRRRFERMRKTGFLQGWQIIVNPHLIACEAASFDLTIQEPETASKVITQLKLIHGMIYVLTFYGGGLRIMAYYPNEDALNRQIALMEAICGGKSTMLWKPIFPECNLKMTQTDWSIVTALLKNDPRRKLSAIARDAGVSSRTLNRRLQRMREGYAFFLDAAIDLGKLGGTACALLIQYKSSARKKSADDLILRTLGNVSWSNTSSARHSMFSVHCENITDGERIYQWVKGLDGIEEVKMGIHQDKITVKDWLMEEIEGRAKPR